MTASARIKLWCMMALLALIAVCGFATVASAEPLLFKYPRMTFSFGVEAFDYFGGDFGDAADLGLSLSGDVTLQVGYFAGNIRFGSARAFTQKDYLPFDEGFQFIYITAAPRLYIPPFNKLTLYVFLQPQISLRFLESNTLVAITGNDSFTASAGGAAGIQFIAGIISVTAQAACEYDWRLKSVIVTGGLSVGLTSMIE